MNIKSFFISSAFLSSVLFSSMCFAGSYTSITCADPVNGTTDGMTVDSYSTNRFNSGIFGYTQTHASINGGSGLCLIYSDNTTDMAIIHNVLSTAQTTGAVVELSGENDKTSAGQNVSSYNLSFK